MRQVNNLCTYLLVLAHLSACKTTSPSSLSAKGPVYGKSRIHFYLSEDGKSIVVAECLENIRENDKKPGGVCTPKTETAFLLAPVDKFPKLLFDAIHIQFEKLPKWIRDQVEKSQLAQENDLENPPETH